MRQLAARLAAARLDKRQPPPAGCDRRLWPVIMTLRDLAPRLAALDLDHTDTDTDRNRQLLVGAVWDQWQADLQEARASDFADKLADILSDGDALLVFDGLDEVAESVRGRVRQAVGAILNEYPKVRKTIVTCRVRSYTESIAFGGFTPHELAPFDKDKIRAFVKAWYTAQTPARFDTSAAERKAGDLADAALAADLRELSENPMLLTVMAIIHQRDVGLPRERVRLYSSAVDVLLSRWQKRKGIPVSPGLETVLTDTLKLRRLMRRLAYEAHQQQSAKGPEADLSRLDILGLLEQPEHLGSLALADEFLDYVDQRAGLLIGRGGDNAAGGKPKTYNFPHRTFQEYLAGCHMVAERGRAVTREYKARAAASDYWSLAALLGAEELLYGGSGKGDKDLLDLAYSLCPHKPPESTADWRATVWSGKMAALLGSAVILADAEADEGGAAYLGRMLQRLVLVLRNGALPAIERAEAGRALGRLGDPRKDVMDIDAMALCPVPAGPFWMGSPDDDTLAYEDERPLHQQLVAQPYAIGRYPITNAQFGQFVGETGYLDPAYWDHAEEYWQPGQGFKGRYDDSYRTGAAHTSASRSTCPITRWSASLGTRRSPSRAGSPRGGAPAVVSAKRRWRACPASRNGRKPRGAMTIGAASRGATTSTRNTPTTTKRALARPARWVVFHLVKRRTSAKT